MEIGDSFTFVGGKEAFCTIVIGSKRDREDLHSAEILADAVKEVSGVEIVIAEEGEKVRTVNQVLIGSPKTNSRIEALLREDRVLVTKKDLEEAGFLRMLMPEDLGNQGFIIHKAQRGDEEYLILAGATPVGTLYAVNTLVSRLHMEDDRLIVDGLNTRLMPTVNVPAFKYRSLQTGLGGPEWLGPDQYMKEFGYDYKAFVDWLASHKINNILLHNACLAFGLFYDSERFPELVNHYHPNVKREFMSDLIKYAHKRGVSVFFMHNIPDEWESVIRVYPELAGNNVDWSYFPKSDEDWNDYIQCKGEWARCRWGRDAEGRPIIIRGEKGRAVREKCSWVCLNKSKVMEIWRGLWEELLERYDVDGVGAQFGESLSLRCNCEACGSDRFFELELEYFKAMVEVARAKNPDIKVWIWTVPGARDIITHREEYPNLVIIDWGLDFQPFMFQRVLPKGDWYLYHRMGMQPEFGIKEMSMALSARGVEGFQIRSVFYKELDRIYQSFEEFAWNPRLSIDDYAHLYTIKVLRRKHRKVAEAYAHWIRAQGYYEILKYKKAPQAWIKMENYKQRLMEEVEKLNKTLEAIKINPDFVQWLRDQARIYTKEMLEIIKDSESHRL